VKRKVIFERRSKGKRGREKEKERERGEREREKESIGNFSKRLENLKCKRHICIFFSRYNARCEYIF